MRHRVSEYMSLVFISSSCSRTQSSRMESQGARGEGYVRLVSYFSCCMRKHLTQAIGWKKGFGAYAVGKEDSIMGKKTMASDSGSGSTKCWGHVSAVKCSAGLSHLYSVWDLSPWGDATHPHSGRVFSFNSAWKHPHNPEACTDKSLCGSHLSPAAT